MAKRTKTTAAGDDLHLPQEICREILTRLPVKSILRFRSVCKSWYSLVSCPNFISGYYSIRNLNKNGDHVLLHLNPSVYNWHGGVCSFSSHDKSFMESCEHNEIPQSFLGFTSSIVGSCNGLICLKDCRYANDFSNRVIKLLIWNPTIRKTVELPSTYARCDSWCGFGFDSKTSDYKVLSCYFPVDHDNPGMIFQIFDLRKGVWRDLSPRYRLFLRQANHYPECYLDGATHWSAPGIIVSFNFSDECFREINLPDSVEFGYNNDDSSCTTFKSVAFGGLIHVIVFSIERYNGPIFMTKNCSVWTMKEYGVTESWSKVYDIDLQRAQASSSNTLRPYQFLLWENEKVLMLRVHGHTPHEFGVCGDDLVLYNTKSRKSKCVFSLSRPERFYSFPARIRSMWVYEESLVLM